MVTTNGLAKNKYSINYVQQENIPFYLVVTKVDKVNQSEKAKFLKHLKEIDIPSESVFLTSSLVTRTLNGLKAAIEKQL